MKIKIIIPIFFSILIGFLFGKVIFNEYDSNSLSTFEEEHKEKIYFVEAISSTLEKDDYLIIDDNIYVGVTKSQQIASKIKEFYKEKVDNIYIREKYVTDEAFLNILTEYDKIASIAIQLDDIASIEKI